MPKPSTVWEGCCCSSTSTTTIGAGGDGGSCRRGGKASEAARRASGPKTDVDSGRASSGKRRSVGRSLHRSRSAGARKPGNITSLPATSPKSFTAGGGQRGGLWRRTSSHCVGDSRRSHKPHMGGGSAESPPPETIRFVCWADDSDPPSVQGQRRVPNFSETHNTHGSHQSQSILADDDDVRHSVHGGVEDARQTHGSEPNCVLSVHPMPHIACPPNMEGRHIMVGQWCISRRGRTGMVFSNEDRPGWLRKLEWA